MRTSHNLRLWHALSDLKVTDVPLLRSRLKWYFDSDTKYDPPFAQMLDDGEIEILAQWFAETNEVPYIGDSGFVAISFISDLILTNKIKNAVQLGHYAGFGSLVMGMMIRKVSPRGRLISFDIDDTMTLYSQKWIKKAALEDVVRNLCIDASDPLTLQMAGNHLSDTPALIFIDASKQYRNTIREVQMWRDYTHGFIIAHDVSKVAKSDQANGSLGVDDGMRDSTIFDDEELLIIDPATETRSGFPYLDPCGLGIGLSRGTKTLPRSTKSFEDLCASRSILRPEKLRDPEHWFLQEGFIFEPGKLIKRAGRDAWATCFAPIKAEQKLACEIMIESNSHHDIMLCAGGIPGSTFTFRGSGKHTCEIVVGKENSLIGIFGTADSDFTVLDVQVSALET